MLRISPGSESLFVSSWRVTFYTACNYWLLYEGDWEGILTEPLCTQDKVVADTAIVQLRAEVGQLQRDNGDLDTKLQQARFAGLQLMQKLKVCLFFVKLVPCALSKSLSVSSAYLRAHLSLVF